MPVEVVVTGASGFIGSALLTEFKKKNVQVVGLSRQKKKGFTTVSSYLDSPSSSEAVLIHLAQSRDTSNPSEGNEIALCRSLSKKSWQHIVYVSSSIVYGDAKAYPHKTGDIVNADNEYANVKLTCESIITDAGGTCLRFSNIYGPGMAANSVIADILDQVPGIGPLVVRDETPVRDFLWIDDATNCLFSAFVLKPGGILNVGSGKGMSIGNLAKLTLEIAGEHKRPVISKINANKLSSLVLDISETSSILKWSPKIDIKTGLSWLLKMKMNNE